MTMMMAASPPSINPQTHGSPRPSPARSPVDPKHPPPPAFQSSARKEKTPRSNLELEPNPFEKSFGISSTSVSSLRNVAVTRNASNVSQRSPSRQTTSESSNSSGNNADASSNSSGNGPAADASKPTLPPLASIASPSDPNYVWSLGSAGLNSSLRAGPLSPAMLAGPRPQSNNPPSSHHSLLGFDPTSTFRTGLTPSTGLTPLVGGPVAFPPPSPNTAAFLAMVNNSSANAASATITPNTLNALTGVLQSANAGNAQGQRYSNGNSFSVPSQRLQQGDASQQQSQYNNNSNAASVAANGLFLLSQAHQELTKREEAQRNQSQNPIAAPAPQSMPQNNDVAFGNRRGSKRKVQESMPAPTTKGNKRTRSSTAVGNDMPPSKLRRGSTASAADQTGEEDEEEEEDESVSGQGSINGSTDLGGHSHNKKPETEEDKRKNFLERNRQAALKCRQRKKAWLAQLQAKVEFLASENERLTAALVSSREEISRLSTLVGGAGMGLAGLAGVGGVNGLNVPVNMYHTQHAQQQHAASRAAPVSVTVNHLPPPFNAERASASPPQPVAASGDGGRGYGY